MARKAGRPKITPPDVELFRKLAEVKGGNLTEIAKAINVSRATLYKWIEEDSELKVALEDEKERVVDLCESQARILIKGIPKLEKDEGSGELKFVGWHERPSETMIIFTLKTLGKNRGYIERQEVSAQVQGSAGMAPIAITVHSKDDENITNLKNE